MTLSAFVLHRDDLFAWTGLVAAILAVIGGVWRGFMKPIIRFANRLNDFMDQVEEHFFSRDGEPSTFDGLIETSHDHERRITTLEARPTQRSSPK